MTENGMEAGAQVTVIMVQQTGSWTSAQQNDLESAVNQGIEQSWPGPPYTDFPPPDYQVSDLMPPIDPSTGFQGATTQNVISVVVAVSQPVLDDICQGGAACTTNTFDPSTGFVTSSLTYIVANYEAGNVDEHEVLGHGLDGLTDCTSCDSLMFYDVSGMASSFTPSDISIVQSEFENPVYEEQPPPPPPTCSGSMAGDCTGCEPPTCGEEQHFDPGYCACVADTSPIIIDTDGSGFHLTSAADGVPFDFYGDGKLLQMSWTAPGSTNGWLALDRNGNGMIDSAKELFGNITEQPDSDHPNGFIALSVFDEPENGGNGDGLIDKNDAIWPKLLVWIDRNHDGVSQPDELYTLDQVGIHSIGLMYRESRRVDRFGNEFRYKGFLNPDREDKVNRVIYDVLLTSTSN